MSAGISVLGREQLVKNFSSWSASLVTRLVTETEIVQAMVTGFAKSNHPYVDRTGNLTNSIQPGRVIVQDDSVAGEIAARMGYASFVEGGTSRARPFPFLAPAIAAHVGQFRQRISKAIREARA